MTKYLVIDDRFDDRIQKVAWPDSVVRLELFGVVFEQKEFEGVQWLALLQELTFGGIFNHALGGTWPSTELDHCVRRL